MKKEFTPDQIEWFKANQQVVDDLAVATVEALGEQLSLDRAARIAREATDATEVAA